MLTEQLRQAIVKFQEIVQGTSLISTVARALCPQNKSQTEVYATKLGTVSIGFDLQARPRRKSGRMKGQSTSPPGIGMTEPETGRNSSRSTSWRYAERYRLPLLLAIVLVCGAALYTYRVTRNPAGFFVDESSLHDLTKRTG